MNKFRIRASALGKIMTEGRGKSCGLSKTATSYLDEWIISQLYSREKEIKSKYLEKGNQCEEQTIQAIEKFYNLDFAVKNTERREDDFFTGEADLVTNDSTKDAKSSWDPFTFPLLESELSTKDYYYQGIVYMHLWKKPRHDVCYYLADAPAGLIESEAKKESFKRGLPELTEEIFDEFENKMTYSDIPFEYRFKAFSFDFDPAVIEKAKEKYWLCVDYIDQRMKTLPEIKAAA